MCTFKPIPERYHLSIIRDWLKAKPRVQFRLMNSNWQEEAEVPEEGEHFSGKKLCLSARSDFHTQVDHTPRAPSHRSLGAVMVVRHPKEITPGLSVSFDGSVLFS